MNSPFEFEFAGKERKDVYYVGHMNCYKAMENGVPVHNISELAFVVMSKMCIPFTVDSRCYKENMAYFRKHSEDDLLKMVNTLQHAATHCNVLQHSATQIERSPAPRCFPPFLRALAPPGARESAREEASRRVS